MQIKINGKIFDAQATESVLEVCQRNNIAIATLCYQKELLPAEGLCRLCLIKTNQHRGLIGSCHTFVSEGLEVITEDEDIKKARTINLELLWADHAGKCITCTRNGCCQLQQLAKEYHIDIHDFVPTLDAFEKEEQLKLLKESLKNRVVDDQNPSIFRDNQYCVECRRCINVCKQFQTIGSYGMNYRSIQTKVGTPNQRALDCIFCGQCTLYCPTAAITEKDDTEKLEKLLADKNKFKVVQIAPSVRFTLGEMFGLVPGTPVDGKIVCALKKLGADLVFDTTFTADLTIMEEAHELIERLRAKAENQKPRLPMFTSCCPAWVLYVEKYWPDFKKNLSSCKSPQQMLGALIKTYFADKKKINPENIVSISIMPCTAKKYEATRKEMGRDGYQDVDIVITTRELGRLIKKAGIGFTSLQDQPFDRILGISSGAGIIFGATGGVMEAALRTAYEKITGNKLEKIDFEQLRGEQGIKKAEITLPESTLLEKPIKLKVAVVHEIRNAKKLLEQIEKGQIDLDFVEVMACPSGCLGGGGQPIPTNDEIRALRRKAIYERDKNLLIRKAHENPLIKKIYEEFLSAPASDLAKKLLHTKET